MNRPQPKKQTEHLHQTLALPVIAVVAESTIPGKIMIKYNDHEPKSAKLISSIDRYTLAKQESLGRQVLVVFENGDPNLPIITGVMESVIDDIITMEIADKPSEAMVDNNKIVFEANEEIVLKCGKSSIKINKQGKIVIKGTELISRASGNNKIKGSNIQLN